MCWRLSFRNHFLFRNWVDSGSTFTVLAFLESELRNEKKKSYQQARETSSFHPSTYLVTLPNPKDVKLHTVKNVCDFRLPFPLSPFFPSLSQCIRICLIYSVLTKSRRVFACRKRTGREKKKPWKVIMCCTQSSNLLTFREPCSKNFIGQQKKIRRSLRTLLSNCGSLLSNNESSLSNSTATQDFQENFWPKSEQTWTLVEHEAVFNFFCCRESKKSREFHSGSTGSRVGGSHLSQLLKTCREVLFVLVAHVFSRPANDEMRSIGLMDVSKGKSFQPGSIWLSTGNFANYVVGSFLSQSVNGRLLCLSLALHLRPWSMRVGQRILRDRENDSASAEKS